MEDTSNTSKADAFPKMEVDFMDLFSVNVDDVNFRYASENDQQPLDKILPSFKFSISNQTANDCISSLNSLSNIDFSKTDPVIELTSNVENNYHKLKCNQIEDNNLLRNVANNKIMINEQIFDIDEALDKVCNSSMLLTQEESIVNQHIKQGIDNINETNLNSSQFEKLNFDFVNSSNSIHSHISTTQSLDNVKSHFSTAQLFDNGVKTDFIVGSFEKFNLDNSNNENKSIMPIAETLDTINNTNYFIKPIENNSNEKFVSLNNEAKITLPTLEKQIVINGIKINLRKPNSNKETNVPMEQFKNSNFSAKQLNTLVTPEESLVDEKLKYSQLTDLCQSLLSPMEEKTPENEFGTINNSNPSMLLPELFIPSKDINDESLNNRKQLTVLQNRNIKLDRLPLVDYSNQRNSFSCHLCSFKTKWRKNYYSHFNNVHPFELKNPKVSLEFYKIQSGLYVCQLCYFIFKCKASVFQHYLENHTKTSNIKHENVAKCKASMHSTKIKLKEDKSPEHIKVDKLHVCSVCHYVFQNQLKLLEHHFSHKQLKECVACGTQVSCHAKLKEHIKINHFLTNSYMCYICDKKFKLARYLQVHLKNHHEIATKFACPTCPETFFMKSDLQTHAKSHIDHDEIDNTFSQLKQNVHNINKKAIEILSSVSSRICNNCGITRDRNISLAVHLRLCLSNGKRIDKNICSFCNLTVKPRRKLLTHLLYHNKHDFKQITAVNLLCPKCELEAFPNKFLMSQHSLTCNGNKLNNLGKSKNDPIVISDSDSDY